MMNIRPIKTEEDYSNAISRIEVLWGAKKDTTEGDELDLLVTLVESYEIKHDPVGVTQRNDYPSCEDSMWPLKIKL